MGMIPWRGEKVFLHQLPDGSAELKQWKDGYDPEMTFDNDDDGLALLWRTIKVNKLDVRANSLFLPIGDPEEKLSTQAAIKNGKGYGHIFKAKQIAEHPAKSFWLARGKLPVPTLVCYTTERPPRSSTYAKSNLTRAVDKAETETRVNKAIVRAGVKAVSESAE